MEGYTLEALSDRVTRVVEDDRPHCQYPFLYAVRGEGRLVLVDSGTCVRPLSLRSLLRSLLPAGASPSVAVLVVCTHVHYDHAGGAATLRASGARVGLGGGARAFSENRAVTSLAASHGGALPAFEVDLWLREGDALQLDEAHPSDTFCLRVVETPGHTPDSISLFAPWENRLFVGDFIYPYTAIHVDCLGSDIVQYAATLAKLERLSASLRPARGVREFLRGIGADPRRCRWRPAASRDVLDLIAALDGDGAAAAESFLASSGDVLALLAPEGAVDAVAVDGQLVLSCGHVEAALAADEALAELRELLGPGGPRPASVDEGYGEYSSGRFTLVASVAAVAKLRQSWAAT
eukprot:m51a1_g1906 hypothetical protein (350) ;mRNA; f:792095-793672